MSDVNHFNRISMLLREHAQEAIRVGLSPEDFKDAAGIAWENALTEEGSGARYEAATP